MINCQVNLSNEKQTDKELDVKNFEFYLKEVRNMFRGVFALALLGFVFGDVGRVKQNFAAKVNEMIVQQIQNELQASYLYQAYGHYFASADVALPGFAKWFEKASQEERQHATGLIEYINKRGGTVDLNDLNFNGFCSTVSKELSKMVEFRRDEACICTFMSSKKESSCGDRSMWLNGLWAMQETLVLERYVNEQLLALHQKASDFNDPHLSHILEHDYLDEQVESIKKVGDYIRQLERVGPGLGEYMFDKDLS